MKLSVCTDAVFQGESLTASAKRVRQLGISAIEFWGWEDKDLGELGRLREETGVEVAALCTGFVSLVDARQREAYVESLRRTLEVAGRLGCRRIITQTGNELPIAREEQRASLVEGLRACVPYLEEADSVLVVEPLNVRVDHAGYYLSSSDEAAEIVREVGSEHVKLLFDIYHQQITEGDLIRRIREYLPCIGHFHAAGNPGRHELYDSEVDYRSIFRAIRETGYDGYIGLEYFPKDDPAKGLEHAVQLMDGR